MRQKGIMSTVMLLIVIVLLYRYYEPIKEKAIAFSVETKSTFTAQKEAIIRSIESHFQQKKQIEDLKAKVAELEPKASLSVAFASKLNHFLKESNLSIDQPELHLIQTLGFQNMQDKNRLWVDFPGFKKEKNYGLIFRGFTAGIIREQEKQPLALLQADKESIFSIFIGKEHIQGVAFGNGKNITVKYIPSYENPLVGDEVITSGSDHIFYEGIKVGTIISVEKKDMYKIATVKPYVDLKQAHFFYAVEVK